ncbi:MAG: hypothetical protein WBR24_07270, partial [Desulfobacterales bacterium]
MGKARWRRLYCNTPPTDNAAQNLYLKAYINGYSGVPLLGPFEIDVEPLPRDRLVVDAIKNVIR